VILTLYVLTNIAVIVLREGRVQNYRPAFKVPLYPWTNIAGIILFILLILDMGLAAVEISLSVLVLAFLAYFFYGRKRHTIEFALIHLIERIVDRKLTDNTLEKELKEVVLSRDDIIIDRFDDLVSDAVVIDIKEKVTLDSFLSILGRKVKEQIGLEYEEIIELFKERERDGSTAITPFVAIPHIVIPGSNIFKLALVRCKKGIVFTHEKDKIKAVFVLFGTKDERAFHLKALSAIAHIVQDPHFEKIWLKAKDEHQLRDMILLTERKRF